MKRYKAARERQRGQRTVYDIVGEALLQVLRPKPGKHRHHSVCPRCDPQDHSPEPEVEVDEPEEWQAIHRPCWDATVSESRATPDQKQELATEWRRYIKKAVRVMERPGWAGATEPPITQVKHAFDTVISELCG